MTIAQIAALPVSRLAAPKAHLFCWTTSNMLPDAFQVLAAWGFEYKSSFVWCKPQLGTGNYFRVSTEYLLVGVKGKLRFRDRNKRNWIVRRRKRHSQKPYSVREIVEDVSFSPRLELFARRKEEGWIAWGDAVSPEFQRRLFR